MMQIGVEKEKRCQARDWGGTNIYLKTIAKSH